MLFFCITNQITKNPTYLSDITVLRDSGKLDISMNELILANLKELIADNTCESPDKIDLWEWFKLFLYPQNAYECDGAS